MAQLGHFPEALADRCIIVTMQRKTAGEKCDRVSSGVIHLHPVFARACGQTAA
jgi:hypothetical protein